MCLVEVHSFTVKFEEDIDRDHSMLLFASVFDISFSAFSNLASIGNEQCLDVRIAVCGNVDGWSTCLYSLLMLIAGKSTMIGVLTRGVFDDGRGTVRKKVFVHKHESESGRTSSISHQILGYGQDGKCINYDEVQMTCSLSFLSIQIVKESTNHRPVLSWGVIVDKAYKVHLITRFIFPPNPFLETYSSHR